jgi:hypothetical protein
VPKVRIIGWIGQTSEISEHEASIMGQHHLGRGDTIVHKGGFRPDGVDLIQKVIRRILCKNRTFSIRLSKQGSQVAVSVITDDISDLNIGGLELEEYIDDYNSITTELCPGIIDIDRLAQQYPKTIVEDASTWIDGTFLQLTLEPVKSTEINDLRKSCAAAADAARFLGNASASRSKTESNTHTGNAILYSYSSNNSDQNQAQVSGSSASLEGIEKSITNFLIPLTQDPIQSLIITSAICTVNSDDVLRTLSLSSPNGDSISIPSAWTPNSERQLIDIDLSRYEEMSSNLPNETSRRRFLSEIDALNKFKHKFDTIRSIATIDSLSRLFALSPKSIPGIRYSWIPLLEPNPLISPEGLVIGDVMDRNHPTGLFSISQHVLSEHCAVLGKTGTGKTNTLKVIASKVAYSGVPVIIIESAKDEYEDFTINHPGYFEHIRVGISSFSIPVFSVAVTKSDDGSICAPGLEAHIAQLWNAFAAAFPLEGPMIPILHRSLFRVYENVGWILNAGTGIFPDKLGRYRFPSFADLTETIRQECNSLGYVGEIRNNIEAALINRLLALETGPRKSIFCDNGLSYIQQLFRKNCTILCLDPLDSDDDKAFFVSILLARIRQLARRNGWGNSHNKLRSLIIIEEAHRVIPNISAHEKQSPSLARQKEQAVSTFNDAIAEFRAYGIGVCVADQSPSKISIDVLRNVGTKIIHAVQEKEDKDAAASILGITEGESSSLGGLPDRGFAIAHTRSPGRQRPSLVKISLFNKASTEKTFSSCHSESTESESCPPESNASQMCFTDQNNFDSDILRELIKINTDEIDVLKVFERIQWRQSRKLYGIPSPANAWKSVESMTPKPENRLFPEGCRSCKIACRVPIILRLIAPDRITDISHPNLFAKDVARLVKEFSPVTAISHLAVTSSVIDKLKNSRGDSPLRSLSSIEIQSIAEFVDHCLMVHGHLYQELREIIDYSVFHANVPSISNSIETQIPNAVAEMSAAIKELSKSVVLLGETAVQTAPHAETSKQNLGEEKTQSRPVYLTILVTITLILVGIATILLLK